MLDLTGYELSRLLKNVSIRIALVCAILFCGLYVYNEIPTQFNDYHQVYKTYQKGQGFIDSEKLHAAKLGMVKLERLYDQGVRFDDNELGELLLYQDVQKVAAEKGRHESLLRALSTKAGEKEKLEYARLKRVGAPKGAYYTEGWKQVIDFWGSMGCYPAVMITILGVSWLFQQEKNTGMSGLIRSTREGRRRLVTAKISASMLFTLMVVVGLETLNLLAGEYLYSLAGAGAPLENLFFSTPYTLRIWQYWVLKTLLETAVTGIIALFAALVTVAFKNGVVSVAITGGVFLLHELIINPASITRSTHLIPLINNDFVRLRHFGTDFAQVFLLHSQPVTYEQVLVALHVLLLVVLSFGVYGIGRRTRRST